MMQLVLVISSFIVGYLTRELVLGLRTQHELDKQRTLFLDSFYTPISTLEPVEMEDVIFVDEPITEKKMI